MSSAASGCCPGSTVDMISLRLWPPFSGGGLSRLTVSSVKKIKLHLGISVVGFCLFGLQSIKYVKNGKIVLLQLRVVA